MFSAEDFELPLEKQLRLQVIKKEISECTNVDALRNNLETCAESLMRYQHLLSKAVEENLKSLVREMDAELKLQEKGNDN